MAIIYAIAGELTGLVKLGKTTRSPKQRLAVLQAASPDKLHLLGAADRPGFYEQRLHHVFRDERRHGEWFAATVAIAIRAASSFEDWLDSIDTIWEDAHQSRHERRSPERRCSGCGENGHYFPTCPMPGRVRVVGPFHEDSRQGTWRIVVRTKTRTMRPSFRTKQEALSAMTTIRAGGPVPTTRVRRHE